MYLPVNYFCQYKYTIYLKGSPLHILNFLQVLFEIWLKEEKLVCAVHFKKEHHIWTKQNRFKNFSDACFGQPTLCSLTFCAPNISKSAKALAYVPCSDSVNTQLKHSFSRKVAVSPKSIQNRCNNSVLKPETTLRSCVSAESSSSQGFICEAQNRRQWRADFFSYASWFWNTTLISTSNVLGSMNRRVFKFSSRRFSIIVYQSTAP